MSKELEALENIKYIDYYEYDGGHYVGRAKDVYPKEFDIVEKAIKAFEIIKEKRVDVNCFMIYDLKRYNEFIAKNEFMTLTQEEHDLLWEVLM